MFANCPSQTETETNNYTTTTTTTINETHISKTETLIYILK